jgi:hypothetical protein
MNIQNKWPALLALVLLWAWAGVLWAGSAQMQVPEPRFDFGEVGEGEIVNHDFKILIISTDLRQPSFQITLQGQVRPHIELRPGSFVQFSPAVQSAEEKTVDLMATGQDFRVLKIENNLKEKISAQLETVVPGKHYRLKIANLQREGSYSGVIKVSTDHPKKPEVQIRISAHFPPAK